ncbi:glycosyltransferase [Enterobacter cancerogenus]|uniref:glycosyltransferase n=1 Tax=Enterobacter cancerogenus TaxID=69218 RepID=UPI0040581939
MLKVGIPILFNEKHWMGGINYFRNLITAFSLIEQNDIELILFCEKGDVFKTDDLKNVRQVVIPTLLSRKLSNRILNKLYGVNLSLLKAMRAEHVDILSHSPVNPTLDFKTLWWKPDFQEKHYPEFFTSKDISLRDMAVRTNAKKGQLLFSSHDAYNDFITFYGNIAQKKSHILQFVPEINLLSSDDESNKILSIREKYNIDEKYFFLPNQFWKHKNHELVINAVLKNKESIQVVATGALNDYRGGEHIEFIKNLLKKDVNNKFKLLGMIDRHELNYLMKGSLAVINPSRFEGWSTTVEEAKYLGKRLILSDIPVHHEQNPQDAIYVKCDDVDGMIDAMKIIAQEFDPEDEKQRATEAARIYSLKRKEFGLAYYNILKSL